jgi:hypothetical protein
MEERPPARVDANILNKQPRTNDKGWCSSLGAELTVKNKFIIKNQTEPRTLTDSLDKRAKRRDMDILER